MGREYYQVYLDGQWHGDFDTYEEAETYVNAHAGDKEIEILKRDN